MKTFIVLTFFFLLDANIKKFLSRRFTSDGKCSVKCSKATLRNLVERKGGCLRKVLVSREIRGTSHAVHVVYGVLV